MQTQSEEEFFEPLMTPKICLKGSGAMLTARNKKKKKKECEKN